QEKRPILMILSVEIFDAVSRFGKTVVEPGRQSRLARTRHPGDGNVPSALWPSIDEQGLQDQVQTGGPNSRPARKARVCPPVTLQQIVSRARHERELMPAQATSPVAGG